MTSMHKVLIVDDEPNNLQVLRQIFKYHYALIFANNGKKALEAVVQHKPDIMMPDMDGYEVCRQLKADTKTEAIPVLFVTAMSDTDDEARSFDMGAVDYIIKPVSGPIVLRRVRTHLLLVRAEALEKLSQESIHMLGEAGHYNDTDTDVHIWRISAYSCVIAQAAGWSAEKALTLKLAAPLHDTGKIGVPDSILKAPRKLTPEEWLVMQDHSAIGHSILSQSNHPVFQLATEIALNHHEKWDGSSYPNNLSGEAIPESVRIVAIADVFDALTMKRPYKEPWSVSDSVKEIKISARTHFEARLVECFEKCLPELEKAKLRWSDTTH